MMAWRGWRLRLTQVMLLRLREKSTGTTLNPPCIQQGAFWYIQIGLENESISPQIPRIQPKTKR